MSMTAATIAALIYAVGIQESAWKMDAVGPQGERGPLQVSHRVIEELARRGIVDTDGRAFQLAKCHNPGCAMRVFEYYLRAVAPQATPECWARVWRKGPTEWRSDTARRYWEKVKKYGEF